MKPDLDQLDAELEQIAEPVTEEVQKEAPDFKALDLELETLGTEITSPAQEEERSIWDEASGMALVAPGWYHAGQIGKTLRENYNPMSEDVSEIGRSFLRGWLQAPEAVGEAVRFIADHQDQLKLPGTVTSVVPKGWQDEVQKFLYDQSDLISGAWKNLQKSAKVNGVELTAANPAVWQGDFMENPSFTRAAATVLQGIPSLAIGFAAGISGGPIVGAASVGLLDGLQTRGEARAAGASVAEQDQAFLAVAFVNTILEKIPLEHFVKGGPGKLAGMAIGALTEGPTEGAQQFWQNVVAKLDYEPARNLYQGVVESLLVGAVTGGTLGSVTSRGARQVDEAINKLRLAGIPEKQIKEMGYNTAVEFVKQANKPLFEAVDQDGNKIKVSLNDLVAQRILGIAQKDVEQDAIDIQGPEADLPGAETGVSIPVTETTPEVDLQAVVEEAGGKFMGIQEMPKAKDGTPGINRVTFQSPQTGTSISLKVNEVTPELIKQKIEESDKAFVDAGKGEEKATPAEAAKREESPDTPQAEQAIQEAPEDAEVLQSSLPKIVTDLQTITAKANDYRSKGVNPPESLLKRQVELVRLIQDLNDSDQAQTNPRIKSIIREVTGQVDLAPKMVTEMNALKGSLQMAVRTALQTERQTEKSLNNFKRGLAEEIRLRLPQSKERGEFIRAIAGVKYGADLDAIIERVERIAEKAKRKELLKEIKNQLGKINKSGVIDVHYVNTINELMDHYDMDRTKEARASLEKTQAYINRERGKGADVRMPQSILTELSGLYREDLKYVDSNALQNLLNRIVLLRDLGKMKLRMKQAMDDAYTSQALSELAVSTKPIVSADRITNPFKTDMDTRLKNMAADFRDWFSSSQRGLTWIDTVFDKLDGNAGYTGGNYKYFKADASSGYRAFLNLRDSINDRVNSLATKLNLTIEDMNYVGFHAVREQEGGREKLKAMNYTDKEIDDVKLTAPQMQMYTAFRKELDDIWPRVLEVMRSVYNKDLTAVKNYFSFSTDFEALNRLPIDQRFGDVAPDLTDMLLGKTQTQFNRTTPKQDWAKKRVGGRQPVKLNAMEVFLAHIENVTYVIAMADRLKRMSAIARDPAYYTIAGDAGAQFVNDWIDVLARNGNRPDAIRWVDSIRKNTGAVQLAFKAASTLVQGTALMDGATEIGPVVFEGVRLIAKSDVWREFVKANMPEVRNRIGDDPNYADFGGKTLIDKWNQAGFYFLQKFDSLTAASVAAGAYLKYVRENNIPYDISDPSLNMSQEGLEYAQDVVARTQGSTAPKDMPLAFNKGELIPGISVFNNTSITRAVLQFQSFMLKRWDTMTHQGIDLGFAKGDKAKGVNVMGFLMLAKTAELGMRLGMATAFGAIVYSLTGDEPEKEEDDWWYRALMNLLSDVPLLGSVASVTNYGSVPVPVIQLWSRTSELIYRGMKAKKPETKMKNAVRATILAMGATFGVGGTAVLEKTVNTLTPKKKKYLT